MITVKGLWKGFPVSREKLTFKEYIVRAASHKPKKREVSWALKDINFEVAQGECLGIIGRNGAGKSTLLSLLLGVMQPTEGQVEVQGKRTPLLALGAGFHSDMTGRENAILNGVLLGYSEKEIKERLDEIIEFSELGDYVDMPARTYSSGMYMRLAFSVAIHTKPNVLLIDEILSVGDESFRKKSLKALERLVSSGVTTVYVSHSMTAIESLCDRVLWLDKGEIRKEGEPAQIIEEYLNWSNRAK